MGIFLRDTILISILHLNHKSIESVRSLSMDIFHDGNEVSNFYRIKGQPDF